MNPLHVAYAYLTAAIICEVSGTAFLQKSQQFTKLGPTFATIVFYAASFYLLAQALKALPLGVAYAIWGGLGIILTAIVAIVVFRQALDAAALIGIGLIVSGVLVMNLFSQTMSH
jgi:small multidrug resistance pump